MGGCLGGLELCPYTGDRLENIRLQIRMTSSQTLWAEANSKTEYVKFMFYTNDAGVICRNTVARSVRVWDTAEPTSTP